MDWLAVFADRATASGSRMRLPDIDPLTAAWHRPQFERRVKRARSPGAGAMLAVNVDWLASACYSIGHDTLDGYLRDLGQLLRTECGARAIVGRGGDFHVYLPEAGGAGETAERIRARVSAQFSGLRDAVRAAETKESGKPSSYAGLTVSIGVAPAGDHYPTLDAWIAASDAALYEAKLKGRNRVVVASFHSGASND